MQVVPQLIPEGELVTVPVPVPASATDSVSAFEDALNCAVTVELLLRVTVHVLVPEQAPPHPPNVELLPGVAVNVISVP